MPKSSITPEQMRYMIMRRIAHDALKLASLSNVPAVVANAEQLQTLAAKVDPAFFSKGDQR